MFVLQRKRKKKRRENPNVAEHCDCKRPLSVYFPVVNLPDLVVEEQAVERALGIVCGTTHLDWCRIPEEMLGPAIGDFEREERWYIAWDSGYNFRWGFSAHSWYKWQTAGDSIEVGNERDSALCHDEIKGFGGQDLGGIALEMDRFGGAVNYCLYFWDQYCESRRKSKYELLLDS